MAAAILTREYTMHERSREEEEEDEECEDEVSPRGWVIDAHREDTSFGVILTGQLGLEPRVLGGTRTIYTGSGASHPAPRGVRHGHGLGRPPRPTSGRPTSATQDRNREVVPDVAVAQTSKGDSDVVSFSTQPSVAGDAVVSFTQLAAPGQNLGRGNQHQQQQHQQQQWQWQRQEEDQQQHARSAAALSAEGIKCRIMLEHLATDLLRIEAEAADLALMHGGLRPSRLRTGTAGGADEGVGGGRDLRGAAGARRLLATLHSRCIADAEALRGVRAALEAMEGLRERRQVIAGMVAAGSADFARFVLADMPDLEEAATDDSVQHLLHGLSYSLEEDPARQRERERAWDRDRDQALGQDREP
jgi:hypothetical protein